MSTSLQFVNSNNAYHNTRFIPSATPPVAFPETPSKRLSRHVNPRASKGICWEVLSQPRICAQHTRAPTYASTGSTAWDLSAAVRINVQCKSVFLVFVTSWPCFATVWICFTSPVVSRSSVGMFTMAYSRAWF